MNRTRIELKRRLARLHPNKKIGGSDDPELMTPSGLNKIYVYADTETYYCTNGMKPGEHMGKKHICSILQEMDVYPFILSGQFRRFKQGSKNIYESGGAYERTIFIDDPLRLEDFFNDLAYIYNNLAHTPVLLFHNTSFDITALAPLFTALDPDMIFYFYTDDKKNFISGSIQSEKYHFYCELGDTLKYDKNMAIEKAGKIVGIEKIKGMPYSLCDVGLDENENIYYTDMYTGEQKTYPLAKYIEYASRDVTIARKIHERMLRQSHLVNEIMVEDGEKMKQWEFNKKCETRPSHSKNICNHYMEMKGGQRIDDVFRFNLAEQICNDYKELYKQTVISNNGGFTSTNKTIFKYDCDSTRHIKYFDRNSMYPTIMTQPLPYGELLKGHRKPDNCTTGYCIKLLKCKWKGIMSCLKTNPFSDKKVNERRSLFVEKEYLNFLEENCDIEYEIVDTGYQANTTVLRNLIEMYYNKRKECKSKMKELEDRGEDKTSKFAELNDQQEGLKLLMNSLYGKMCEKGHHTGTVYYNNKFTKFKQDKQIYPCILTGSFITYRGRLSLLQKIKAVLEAGYDFLYADTDSVVLGCPKEADLTKIFGVDKGNLGEWKEEGTFDLFLNIGLKKKYILLNRETRKLKPALSGIPKQFENLLMNKKETNFEEMVEELIYMFDPKNNVLIEKGKKAVAYSHGYNQKIIYNTKFQMNPSLKNPTAYITMLEDTYVMRKCTEE